MTIEEVQIILIAVLTATACAIPGVFLILRRMSLMSDAISHSILLGIVLAFFIVEDLASPLLIVGAGLTGLLTVALVETLNKYTKVMADASVGMVFPALFSIAVILINLNAKNVHLDIDAVLLGELAFAPFNTLTVGGINWGPKSIYVMFTMLLINIFFVSVFYKELKLSTFDAGLATTFGLFPLLIHYVFMGIVSITAVGAFDSVGSILVVALMIAPPCGAYLLTDNLCKMILLSAMIGIVSALLGFFIAKAIDTSIAGSMATMTGVCFLLIVLFAPKRGVFALHRRKFMQKYEFARGVLVVHLSNHQGPEGEKEERREDHLTQHIHWDKGFSGKIVEGAIRLGLIDRKKGVLYLTPSGFKLADRIMEQ